MSFLGEDWVMTLSRKLPAAALVVLMAACAPSDKQASSADSTARNLTLVPQESTATSGDVPAAAQPAPPPPQSRPPAPRPAAPPKPAAPTSYSLSAGTSLDISVRDTITSKTAKVGDVFTATVSSDVKDRAGHVVVPAGSVVQGSIMDVKPAPNPNSAGTMVLAVQSVTIRGRSYDLDAAIDSVATVMKNRGVTGGDAAKVGAGAAAGAILGRIVGKNSKGTVIGGVVGGAIGAGVAAGTKDVDIVVPAGARAVLILKSALTVRA
jgi:hypothetical protein